MIEVYWIKNMSMDYEKLIEYLIYAANVSGVCEIELKDAATAIENLLAERNAALKFLHMQQCRTCKYSDLFMSDLPCCHCFVTGGMSDCWEWRGLTPDDK